MTVYSRSKGGLKGWGIEGNVDFYLSALFKVTIK